MINLMTIKLKMKKTKKIIIYNKLWLWEKFYLESNLNNNNDCLFIAKICRKFFTITTKL